MILNDILAIALQLGVFSKSLSGNSDGAVVNDSRWGEVWQNNTCISGWQWP